MSALHIRWPAWSFSISPSNEYSGLIFFSIEWFDLLAAQGTLKSFLQHHNSKTSILQCSAFFVVELPHLYMTSGKTIAHHNGGFVKTITRMHLLSSKYLTSPSQNYPGQDFSAGSVCQSRGHRFNPWSGRVPLAAEQLSPRTTTTEPTPRVRAPQQEKPLQ